MRAYLRRQLIILANLFIFIPYYCNVSNLLKTFFSPWKRIVFSKQTTGFSLSEWFERGITNMASRCIGMAMRSSVLVLCIFLLLLFVVVTPVWVLIIILFSPLAGLYRLLFPISQQKSKEKELFIHAHTLSEEFVSEVGEWWDRRRAVLEQSDPFSLHALLCIPPIGRDWAYGFTPQLDKYTTELATARAYNRQLIDRQNEITDVSRELARSYEANCILVGEEGVGKHTIVDGFARGLYEGTTIPPLQNMRILNLHMEKILSQSEDQIVRSELLASLLAEAARAKNIILVIDDFHRYCSSHLDGDFSSVWVEFGKLPVVKFLGVTTPYYYEEVIVRKDKIVPLFQKIAVAEVARDKALVILEEKTLLLESMYHIRVTYEALERILEQAAYYITTIPFPEKAISLLHDAVITAKDLKKVVVVPEDIDMLLTKQTHMPVGTLSNAFKQKLTHVEDILNSQIVGQSQAIHQITLGMQRAFIDTNRTKPKASFLFLGSTGVGKTETAKALASVFFEKRTNMTRFDMSFYQTQEAVGELIGSSESRTVGLFAQAIREKPYAVLLIDEIEKAHTQIQNVLLTLLDEGYVVDGYGKRVDCKNCIVIATSNAGSSKALEWANEHDISDKMRDYLIEQSIFTSEFLNRFDKVLVFTPLTRESAYVIGKQALVEIVKQYKKSSHVDVSISDEELESIVKKAFHPKYGAREVVRAVHEYASTKAAKTLL
ncbi:MAG: AAA family ATPase [Candidatus Roizmanbacteria bacterium]|nr:AAA family ATPase [Candidatus Roizmanbacteria bacterium]